jgi:hypothetical protein
VHCRRRQEIKRLLGFLVVVMTVAHFVNLAGPEKDPNHIMWNPLCLFAGLVGFMSIVQPATIALAIVIFASSSWKPSPTLSAAISCLSSQTYEVFLLHPLILIFLFEAFPPSTWYFTGARPPLGLFWAFGALTFALSILGGYVVRAVCSAVALGASKVAHAV